MSKIMVVPASLFDHLKRDVLITEVPLVNPVCRLINENKIFLERDNVENDVNYRQPIPYVLVKYDEMEEYVLMQRGKGQAEARLHDKFYIGAGGHVEENHTVTYTANLEVAQELGSPLAFLQLLGILITTGSSVEDVHLCCFYRAVTRYREFNSPERELHNAKWANRKELAEKVKDMEKWSQIICRDYLSIK